MRKLLTFLTALAFSFSASAQFNLSGTATQGGGVINLVPLQGNGCWQYLAGSAWSTTPVNWNNSFILDFEAAFVLTGGSGADGFVVVFGNNINTAAGGSLNAPAGYLGYYNAPSTTNPDFQNSIGIEFDIFENNASVNDPGTNVNHVMVAQNSNWTSVVASSVPIHPSGTSVEDNAYHQYRVEWNCSLQQLDIYYEPAVNVTPRISIPGFNPATYFSNPASTAWGFTGGRGSSCSDHLLRNISMQTFLCDGCMRPEINVQMDDMCNFHFSVTPNPAFNVIPTLYIWDFGDGSPIVNTTSPNTTHTYPAPGTYTGLLKVVGYNTETGECCTEEVPFRVDNPCDKKGGGGEGGNTAQKPGNTSGIDAVVNDKDVIVAPNPSKGVLNLEMSSTQFNKLVIMDIAGKKVYSEEFNAGNSKQIQLGKLSNGLYIVELQDVKGNTHKSKFVLDK